MFKFGRVTSQCWVVYSALSPHASGNMWCIPITTHIWQYYAEQCHIMIVCFCSESCCWAAVLLSLRQCQHSPFQCIWTRWATWPPKIKEFKSWQAVQCWQPLAVLQPPPQALPLLKTNRSQEQQSSQSIFKIPLSIRKHISMILSPLAFNMEGKNKAQGQESVCQLCSGKSLLQDTMLRRKLCHWGPVLGPFGFLLVNFGPCCQVVGSIQWDFIELHYTKDSFCLLLWDTCWGLQVHCAYSLLPNCSLLVSTCKGLQQALSQNFISSLAHSHQTEHSAILQKMLGQLSWQYWNTPGISESMA